MKPFFTGLVVMLPFTIFCWWFSVTHAKSHGAWVFGNTYFGLYVTTVLAGFLWTRRRKDGL